MDPNTIYKANGTASMPYGNCKTRIISLLDFEIPETATEEEYSRLYHQISQSDAPASQALTDAVRSMSIGIAPPVAFPTETVYGLGADATSRPSIAGIFAAKGRPNDNPLIVHVASKEHLERLTGESIPAVYADLVKEHWPGPLTILVPVPTSKSIFAPNVHPGQQTIGFRVPSSKYARFFIAATGRPIAAPSANSSGKPSPTTAQHVFDDLKGKINFILDAGNCDIGVESTVVDGLHDPPLILRPGGLSQDGLITHGRRHGNTWARVAIGYKQTHHDGKAMTNGHLDNKQDSIDEAPRAPGMKYKHYAPKGRMILFEGRNSATKLQAELDALIDTVLTMTNGTTHHDSPSPTLESLNIAILTSISWPSFVNLPVTLHESSTNRTLPGTTHTAKYRTHTIHSIPLGRTPQQIAQALFAALRTCDDLGCRFILAEAPVREKFERELVNGSDNEGNLNGEVEEQLHQFDAVLERTRKAASLVVSS